MTSAHLLGLTLMGLAAAAPLLLATGLRSHALTRGLAILVSLAAVATGIAALPGPDSTWRLPILRSQVVLDLPVTVSGGGLTAVIALTVLVVTCAVQIFAAWYLADDERYPAFAATVSLFAAAMVLLVTARDLVLILVGWEVMGWCSYLLIGHWSQRASARRAAYKAFLVTRLADAAFILGVVGLIALARTSDLTTVVQAAAGQQLCSDTGACVAANPAYVDLALTLLVIGVLGKSAQLPFSDWLTDAMEGPTPASALIHAATMVAAGTWVLSRLAPALLTAPVARWVLAISVALTMTLAAFTAFLQTDLKRLLAWSTISQIGIMLAPLAVAQTPQAAANAAGGHLFAHAIFKALLFLTVGWLAVAAGSTTARDLTGSAIGRGFARVVWGAGLLALAGVPLTVGGLSKEEVIAATAHAGTAGGSELRAGVVMVALLVTVALTAAYATRAYEIVASDRGPRTPPGHEPRPLSPLAAIALAVLAAGSIAGGLVFVLGPFPALEFHAPLLGLTLVLILVGMLVGWYLRPDDRREAPRLMRAASRGYGVDTAYVRGVGMPVLVLARLVAFLDREVIDTYVKGAGWVPALAGRVGELVHRRERIATDLLWVIAGLLVLAALVFVG